MSATPIPWKHVRNVLVLFAPLWMGTMVIFGGLGSVYAFFRTDLFVARQPIVVRDEASATVDRLGRFGSQTELKAAQETILEMTQNPDVVAAALRVIGPASGRPDPEYPDTATIDGVARDCVNLLAPKGSQFGNTEVVYLEVKTPDSRRSLAFCRAMFDSLSRQLRRVREVRTGSVIAELTYARDLAAKNLNDSAARMREIEMNFGTDLGELRNLNDTISGDGTNRRALEELTREADLARAELERLESLEQLLRAGVGDPDQLLISGNDLLASQPSLQRLKDGLIDAQIESSKAAGLYQPSNPRYKTTIAAEAEIRKRMQHESEAVVRAMQPKLRLERERVARLNERKENLSRRLAELATIRTHYAKIDAEVKRRTELLADAEASLTGAQASRAAAMSTNLIAELGPPRVNENPVGPGDFTMTIASTVAGLMFGLGTVFLIAPGPSQTRTGRRWSDYLTYGRRSSDRVAAASGGDRRQIAGVPRSAE